MLEKTVGSLMHKHSRHPERLHSTADNCPHAVLPAHSIDSADMRTFENVSSYKRDVKVLFPSFWSQPFPQIRLTKL